MATKLLLVSAAFILFATVNRATAQFRYSGFGYGYGHHHPYYQQQTPAFNYPKQNNLYLQQQLPAGVSVQDAEWVCKNPKTGDMLIISSEDIPTNAGNTGKPQQPNYPQPTVPPPTQSYPTLNPQQPITDAPNTNGDGVIDIRSLE